MTTRRVRNQKNQNKLHVLVFSVVSVLLVIAVWLLSQNNAAEQLTAMSQSQTHVSTTDMSTVQQTSEQSTTDQNEMTTVQSAQSLENETSVSEISSQQGSTTKQGMTYVGDNILLVNKVHGIPATYAPGENPTAKQAFIELTEKMRSLGFDISVQYSGFRSYETQAKLYQDYVQSNGQEQADRFSARPGYSEHQTGLAFDVLNGAGGLLGSSQNDSQAVTWLAENAHQYGFIVRYLPDKEDITGYMSEPWHIRYVGNVATAIYQSGKTLEEYYGVEGGRTYR